MFGNRTLVDLLRFDKLVQARTKVPSKGPVRHVGDRNRRSGTSLGSIGAARAHLRAHAHQAASASSPAPRFGNLKLTNTFSIDARQALKTSSTCARTKLSDPRFGLHCRRLLPKVFILKIFNRTFLLILIGSRRDPGLVSEEVLASVRFSSRSINKSALNVIKAFVYFLLSAYNR
jgi:hypothetical protein